MGDFFNYSFSLMTSLSSLAAFLISFPDSPTFLPNLGRRLPPKRIKRTTARIRISGQPIFLNIFFCNFNKHYLSLLADLNSLIAEEIPRMSSGIFLVPKRAMITTAMMTISVVPIFSI